MKPFFQERNRQRELLAQAQDWMGTPFHPHAAIKGGGVDCVWLAASIYLGCRAIAEFDPPPYTMDGGAHNEISQVVEWLNHSGRFQKCWQPGDDLQPEVGDLLCFKVGRVIHHVGIVTNERCFVHVMRSGKVMESFIDDSTWRKRLAAIYRPLEVAS